MRHHVTNNSGAIKRSHILAFLAIALVICVIGYGYFRNVRQLILAEKTAELRTIAIFKEDQIVQWRKERLGDGLSIQHNPLLADRLRDYLEGSRSPVILEEFKIWIESLRTGYDYRSVALYGVDGRMLVAVHDAGTQLDLMSQNLVEQSVHKSQVYFSDFHRDEDSGYIHLNLVVPVGHSVGNQFKPLAVLVLDVDPNKFLYPLIYKWPTASKSAETILLERNGDDALFLSDARNKPDTALSLRMPLARKEMPGVRAVLGHDAVFEGKDYNNAPVLAATKTIAGSPWSLVAKIELDEIYEPLKTQALWVTLFCALLVLATGLGIYNWWSRRTVKSLRESDEKFRAVAAHTYDWEYWKAVDGIIFYCSPSCERISGYTAEQFRQDPDLLNRMIHPDDRDRFIHHLDFGPNGLEPANCQIMDFRIHTSSGEERWIAHVCQEIFDEQGASLGRRACNRDITIRKTIEESLAVSQAELQAIYDNAPVMMCLVNPDGCIIYANQAFTDFTGISQEGLEGGHACGVFGCVNAQDDPRGCGYGLNCLNCSLMQTIDDTFKTGNTHQYEEHDFTIDRDGNRQSFTLLGSTVRVDSASNPRLLLCLQNITEHSHLRQLLQSEEALKRQISMFASLLKNLSVGVFMVEAPSGKPLVANDAARDLLGRGILPDATRNNLSEVYKAFKAGTHAPYPPEEMPIVLAINGEASHVDDMVIERPDGTQIHLEVYGSPTADDQGHVWASLASFADITAQKMAEKIIRDQNKELERLVAERTRELEGTNYELTVINVELNERRHEAEENREKLLQLSTAVENSPVSIVITDKLGNIEYVNPRFTEISGYQPEEAIGQNPRILKADNQPKLLYQDLWETILAGNTWRGDLCNQKKNGEIHWEHASISPIRDEDGTVTHFVAIKDDITEQRELMEDLLNARDAAGLAKERLVLATKIGGIGVWEYDLVNNSLVWDKQMFHLYGVSPEEFTGAYDTWRMGIHPDDLQRCDREVELALQGKRQYDTEFRVVWPDGSVHFIRAAANVQRGNSGRPLRMIGTNWDITGFKQTEVQLKDYSDQLKHKNDELKEAMIVVEQAGRAKGEFLANMSHEIRTPLNAIIGFSALALKNPMPPRLQDFVGKIHTAGELLLNIINDILDFSKNEAGQLKLEQTPFRLNIIVDNASSMVRQKARDKGLNLYIETPPETSDCLVGDPHRLSQIIVNLLNNAVKFTEHGEIRFETTLLEQEESRILLKFSVRDTGIGITAEQISKLFQPFTQADGSNTRRFGGTGLGLSISKQLAENMGGEIWCESTPGEGSTFSFTAWFGLCQEHDMEQCTHTCAMITDDELPSFDFSGSRVLLVEDNEINRQLAMELLKDTGVAIDVAENGEEAVTMITGGTVMYDLVLMDIQMPVMNGYEATRIIRDDSRFASLPVIAMTAHAMEEERQKILKAGIDAHIAKPIEARTLLQVMRFFLGQQESSVNLHQKHADVTDDGLALPIISGLNVADALSRMDGNRNLYRWVMDSFVENQTTAASAIEKALSEGDSESAARQAHTIKGIAGTLGAEELEKLGLELENAILLDGSPASSAAILDRFAAELRRLVMEINSYLSAAPPDGIKPSATVDLLVVTPILKQLQRYIQDNDGRAERYLDDFQTELNGLPEKDIGRIKKYLKNFALSAAHAELLALADKHGIELED